MNHWKKYLLISALFAGAGAINAEETAGQAQARVATQQQAAEEQEQKQEQVELDTQKISEAFGHLIVRNLETPGFKFEVQNIIKGIQDASQGLPSPMTQEEYEEAIIAIQERSFQVLSEENLSRANQFLDQNIHAEGIVSLENGKLQYKIEKAGEGAVVEENMTPLIHYKGSFLDGTTFGSSLENDKPISLPLKHTIPGFNKGIVGMREGEKRTLYIHPELGYGTAGHLPPNSLLVFEVEIVKSNNQNEAPKAGDASTSHVATAENFVN